MKILITGLPGSGKTILAEALRKLIPFSYYLNGDMVRTAYNDWDFSPESRIRQAKRMREIAEDYEVSIEIDSIVIMDFICPTERTRKLVNADYVVFMNTIKSSQYADTDALYETPTKVDIEVTEKDARWWALLIKADLKSKFDLKLFDFPSKT